MKKTLTLLLIIFVFSSCKNEAELKSSSKVKSVTIDSITIKKAEFAIIIHGGAGTIKKEFMSDKLEAMYKTKLEEAIRVGHEILKNGGSSIDAVQKTINILEDSPLFNAGKGAVFTNAGTNEHDASIMDGNTLNAGASAGTKNVKNPINLARVIMDNSLHVMLAREGAENFAEEQGLKLVDPKYFFTEKSMQSLKRVQDSEKDELTNYEKTAFYDANINDSKFGTVGCAALDKHGNLAAGTSTGGMTNKRWGRIGDVPIIGAGTYANNNTCAVSSTGWGEYFIRSIAAYDISALMEYKGLTLQEAAKEVIQKKIPNLGGNGGVIAVDKNGNFAMEFNTSGMFRATMNDKDELYIAMYKEE